MRCSCRAQSASGLAWWSLARPNWSKTSTPPPHTCSSVCGLHAGGDRDALRRELGRGQLEALHVVGDDLGDDQPVRADSHRRAYRVDPKPVAAVDPEHLRVVPDEPEHLVRIGAQQRVVHPLVDGGLALGEVDDARRVGDDAEVRERRLDGRAVLDAGRREP